MDKFLLALAKHKVAVADFKAHNGKLYDAFGPLFESLEDLFDSMVEAKSEPAPSPVIPPAAEQH